MASQVLDVLVRSMAGASVPHGLLDPLAQHFLHQNDALAQVLERHRMTTGSTPAECLSELQPAAQRCRETLCEAEHTWPQSQTRLVLLPLIEDGQLIAIQCFAHEATDVQLQRLQLAMNHLPVGIWLAKPDGQIYWVNQANPAYMPMDGHEAYFQSAEWVNKIHPDDLVVCGASFAKAAVKGKVEPFEYRMQAHDGQMHWFYTDGGPVADANGQVDFWAGITLDIQQLHDERQAHADEVARLKAVALAENVRLEGAQAELSRVQKMELVGQLAGSVAHDFNNLLFVIRLNTGLLRRASTDPKAIRYADQIQRDVARAARTASELMTFSGRQPQLAQVHSVRDLLHDIEDLLTRAVGAEVDFSLQFEEPLGHLHVDKTYFENALINLAINARDAVHGKGKVQLRFRTRSLSHDGSTRDWVQIEVEDDGEGMSEATQARIFEPFFTTKDVGKGTGLGLSMVASFVAMSGGFIQLSSALGEGTRFVLNLPACDEVSEAAAEEVAPTQPGNQSILLIEDDLDLRNALAQVLIDMGYLVVTAYSPDNALQYLRNGLKPELIISDIRMPGKATAMDMVRELEAQGQLPPVLFMTGYAAGVAIEEGLVEGRYPVIFKPVSVEDLAAKVREVLGHTGP